MRRNWMIGVAVGVLVAASLLVVGIGAYNAGQRHGETVEVVSGTETAGRTLVVPVDGWRDGWHGGPGPGFLVFPLVVIGLVLLFSARRRGGWGGPWRYGNDEAMREWHRRAHADDQVAPPGPTSGS